MPRIMSITVTPDQADKLVPALDQAEGVLSVQLQRGASVRPEADVVTALASNQSLFSLMRLVEETIGGKPASFTLSSPAAVFSGSSQDAVDADIVESIWEEAEYLLQQTSRTGFNFVILMVLSGVLAAIGLSAGVLHLVLAAMLIIPGFQPIANIPLGIVLRNMRLVRLGAKSTLYGYAVFTLAAIVTFHALRLVGAASIASFVEKPMVQYWASYNTSTFIVSIVAAAAGITIIPTHRSVLTAGVMIALALVPGASIFGISLTSGQWEYALRGLAHWLLDVSSIIVTGIVIFGLKKALVHKRGSWD